MSDVATEGSVARLDAASAGNLETQVDTTANGSTVVSEANPLAGLSEGNRTWGEAKGWKTVDDIATQYRALEGRLGSAINVPAADASAEDWSKFYSKLPEPMRPVESADKLTFKRPDGLPENLPYSDDLANASKDWMVKNKVPPAMAQGLHDEFARWSASQFEASQKAQAEATAKDVTDTHAALTKEWGPEEGEAFKQRMAEAGRAAKGLGLMDALKKGGLVLEDGAITDPQLAKALSAVGERMFREDTIGSDPAAVMGNPFKDANGQRNITAISTLVKNDPQRAARLAREAGENPADWGIRANG